MDIEQKLHYLIAALHETSIREAALFLNQGGGWECLAGGHHAVSLGEWAGDFAGVGENAGLAIDACMTAILTAAAAQPSVQESKSFVSSIQTGTIIACKILALAAGETEKRKAA